MGYNAEGDKLSTGQRFLGVVPYVGKAKNLIKVVKAIDKAEDVYKATKAGIEFENKHFEEIEKAGEEIVRRVSYKAINPKTGKNVRAVVDGVTKVSKEHIETKLRSTTKLSKNQKIVYKALEEGKATPVGRKAVDAGLDINKVAPPTKVTRANNMNNRKDLFFNYLTPFFKEKDFIYSKKNNGFIKKVNGAQLLYVFQIWPQAIQVAASLEIIIQEVEAIKKNVLKNDYNNHMRTIGREKRYLMENISDGYSLTDNYEKCIESAQKEIEYFRTDGIAFFEKFSSLVEIDRFLNQIFSTKNMLAYNIRDNAYLAIIIAGLVKNNNVKEVIEFNKSVLKSDMYNHRNISNFDSIANYILNKYFDEKNNHLTQE